MTAPRVRVAVPWLQGALAAAASSDALPAMPALGWLGGRGRLETGATRSWREWLLEPVGGTDLLARWPAGPTLAHQDDLTPAGQGSWCVAQPVHLAAGLDHLRLVPLEEAVPSGDEADELGAVVNSHFGADELSVAAFVAGGWLLHFPRPVDCWTHPPESVVGHDVHEYMPAGPDGARIRSLMNEIQMLLHEHPVNQRRERARQLPVNGWWLWGFGEAVAHPSTIDVGQWRLCSDDAWLRALWQGSRQHARDGMAGASEPLRADTVIALSQPTAQRVDEALTSIDSGLLSALMAHVQRGRLQSLDLLVGSAALHVGAHARLQFWRRPADLSRWLA